MNDQTPPPTNVGQTQQTPFEGLTSSPISLNEAPEGKKATSTHGKAVRCEFAKSWGEVKRRPNA